MNAGSGAPRALAAGVAVLGLGCAALFWINDGYPAALLIPARVAAGLAVLLSLWLCGRRRELLLTPLPWTALLFFVGFVVSPWVFLTVEQWWPLWVKLDHRLVPRALAYTGSMAEGLMIQAALASAGANAAFVALTTGRAGTTRLPLAPGVAAAIGLAAALAHATRAIPADVSLPLVMLTVAALVAAWAVEGRIWPLVVVLPAALAACIVNGEAKFPVVMLAMTALASLVWRGWSRWIAGLVLGALAVAVAVPVGMFVIKRPDDGTLIWQMDRIARAKLLVRQDETAHCLRQVVERHWQDGLSGGLGGLASALVPRAVWPTKPQLSDGTFYATEYCGHRFDPWDVHTHSSSLTVLGEPVREDGRVGGLKGTLVLLLLGLGAAALTRRPGGAVPALALLPWLVDIDQNFAMYLARSVKAALVVALLLFLAYLAGRAWRRQ